MFPYFLDLYKFLLYAEINIAINTNGLNSNIQNIDINITIIVSLFAKENLLEIISNLKSFQNVIILDYCNLDQNSKNQIPKNWKLNKSLVCKPKINKSYLVNMDIQNFFARKEKNKCLDSKIAILENGDVFPCFGTPKEEKIGNAKKR